MLFRSRTVLRRDGHVEADAVAGGHGVREDTENAAADRENLRAANTKHNVDEGLLALNGRGVNLGDLDHLGGRASLASALKEIIGIALTDLKVKHNYSYTGLTLLTKEKKKIPLTRVAAVVPCHRCSTRTGPI